MSAGRGIVVVQSIPSGIKTGSVKLDIGLDEVHQQIITLGDPLVDRLARVASADPAASDAGLVARQPHLTGRFYQLLQQNIPNGHEMRTHFTATDLYFGMAVDGTATNAAEWDALRIYLNASGSPTRWRTVAARKWDDIIAGTSPPW